MTLEAAHDSAEEPAGCGHLRRRLEEGLAVQEQLTASIQAEITAGRLPDSPDLLRRLTLNTQSLRELRGAYAGHVFAEAFGAETQAQDAGQAPGRHRAAGGLADVLPLRRRGAHGIGLAALLAAAKGHLGYRAARMGLTATVAAGAGAGIGVTAYTMQTVPDQGSYAPPKVAIRPAADPDSPAAAPQPQVTAWHPKPRGRHHRPAAAGPVLSFPDPSPPPAVSPPPPSPPPSPGVLGVAEQPGGLTVSRGGTGLLDLTAQGGPVTWTATTTAGITVDVAAGTLGPGQAAQIQVTVDPALLFAPGTGQVTVNGVTVNVTWG